MKLHPYVSDKTLHHFPRSLQNPSGLLGVGRGLGSAPRHMQPEKVGVQAGGSPMCLWTHWAWEALSCCVNTAHPRWPGTFCVKTTQLAVRSGGSSSRCGWGGPGAGCPHVGTGWLSPAHGHDPRTYPETVACSLLRFVFQIKLQKRTKNSRNGVTNEVIYSIQRVEPHRNHLRSHMSCLHARVRRHTRGRTWRVQSPEPCTARAVCASVHSTSAGCRFHVRRGATTGSPHRTAVKTSPRDAC